MTRAHKRPPRKITYHTFGLFEPDEEILNELWKKGFNLSDALRQGLRLLYRKEFPPYVSTKTPTTIELPKTPEDKCEELGGEIINENGTFVCVYSTGKVQVKKPLASL